MKSVFIIIILTLTACSSGTSEDAVQTAISGTREFEDKLATAIELTLKAYPTETPIPTPTTHKLKRNEIESVVAWVMSSLTNKNMFQIAQVTGELEIYGNKGVFYGGYPSEWSGYFTKEEFYNWIADSLKGSNPLCIGYAETYGGSLNKATLFVEGLNMDWQGIGLLGNFDDIVNFHIWSFGNGWELIGISAPASGFDIISFVANMQSCP